MKIFRFEAEGGRENEHFGSVKVIISKILDLEDKAEISSVTSAQTRILALTGLRLQKYFCSWKVRVG